LGVLSTLKALDAAGLKAADWLATWLWDEMGVPWRTTLVAAAGALTVAEATTHNWLNTGVSAVSGAIYAAAICVQPAAVLTAVFGRIRSLWFIRLLRLYTVIALAWSAVTLDDLRAVALTAEAVFSAFVMLAIVPSRPRRRRERRAATMLATRLPS
jgi:hypothetical protein